MGVFTQRLYPVNGAAAAPVTIERITRVFEQNSWEAYNPNPGIVVSDWDFGQVHLFLHGDEDDPQLIMARVRFDPPQAADKRNAMIEFCADFNDNAVLPRASILTNNETGEFYFYADFVVPCRAGATDEQLDLFVSTALESFSFFKEQIDKFLAGEAK